MRYSFFAAILGVVVASLFEKVVGRTLFAAGEHKLLLLLIFFVTGRGMMMPVINNALNWVGENLYAIIIIITIAIFFFKR